LKKIATVAGLVVAALLLTTTAFSAPILDGNRIAIGVGGSYDWHAGDLNPAPPQRSEFCVNAFGAYSLTSHFSAVARGAYGAGNRTFRASPGVHFNTAVGSEAFALALTYDFYAGDFDPAFPNEWAVGLIYSRPLGKYVTGSVVETYGFDNHEQRTSVQLTAPLFVGKEKD
jgi:hypothetical protein